MKIAIISDTHDNLINFKKALSWIKKRKIKTIIHCGDVFKPSVLKRALENFSGKTHIVFGNTDKDYFSSLEDFKSLPKVKIWTKAGEIETDKRKIAFCHLPESAKHLAGSQKYDIVFYGHSHKPWIEKIGKTKLVNPGNLAGIFYKATFAFYDTKTGKLELKILEKLK